jgi:hypothetical protein
VTDLTLNLVLPLSGVAAFSLNAVALYLTRKERQCADDVVVRAEFNGHRASVATRMDQLRGDVGRLHDRIDELRGSLTNSTETLRREVKEDVAGVQARVNEVLTCVARLQGKVEDRP